MRRLPLHECTRPRQTLEGLGAPGVVVAGAGPRKNETMQRNAQGTQSTRLHDGCLLVARLKIHRCVSPEGTMMHNIPGAQPQVHETKYKAEAATHQHKRTGL